MHKTSKAVLTLFLILSMFMVLIPKNEAQTVSSLPWKDDFNYNSVAEMKNAGWSTSADSLISVSGGYLTLDNNGAAGASIHWNHFASGITDFTVEIRTMWTGREYGSFSMSVSSERHQYDFTGDGYYPNFAYSRDSIGQRFSGYSPKINTWASFVIERKGTAINLYWNNNLVKTDTETSPGDSLTRVDFNAGWENAVKIDYISVSGSSSSHTSFMPDINGFSFSNYQVTELMKKSMTDAEFDISSAIRDSPIGNIIPASLYDTVANLAFSFANKQKGYCGGMVLAAKQYYEDPTSLPEGCPNAHAISNAPDISPTALPDMPQDTKDRIWNDQWIAQTLNYPGILKLWALSLGSAPSGLVPFNEEIEWILKQLDQGSTVPLTLFQKDPWDVSHAVLAYDYSKSSSGNDVYLYVYGPNYGNQPNYKDTYVDTGSLGEQTIHLTKDGSGNYAIANGEIDIEGLRFFRLGAAESLIGVDWDSLAPHLGEIASHVLDALTDLGNLLCFEAQSPVTLMLTTPAGQHVGYNSTTQMIESDLSNALYSGPNTEPQILVITNSTPGNYTLDITGNASGSYTINAFQMVSNVFVKQNLTFTGTTYQGKIDRITTQLSENGNMILSSSTGEDMWTKYGLWIVGGIIGFVILAVSIILLRRRKKGLPPPPPPSLL